MGREDSPLGMRYGDEADVPPKPSVTVDIAGTIATVAEMTDKVIALQAGLDEALVRLNLLLMRLDEEMMAAEEPLGDADGGTTDGPNVAQSSEKGSPTKT